MMGWSPRCYIPSFVEIGLPVPEKNIFEGFYHILAWRPSLSCDHQIFFFAPESFHKNLVQIGTVVFEKTRVEFLYVDDFGPRSRGDIDLQYSRTVIYSIRRLLLLSGHWLQ